MGARQYTNREWKLLSWWLATFHPRAEILMNVRVGNPPPLTGIANPTAAELNMTRVRNRWVDAIYVEDGVVTIVEAKMTPDPGIFSQLIHYARKFRVDPSFATWQGMPLHLVALVYSDDPSVSQEASWYGVQWVVWQPALAGFLPAQVLGTPIASEESLLPQDWPARLSRLLTGKSWSQS